MKSTVIALGSKGKASGLESFSVHTAMFCAFPGVAGVVRVQSLCQKITDTFTYITCNGKQPEIHMYYLVYLKQKIKNCKV